MDEHNTHIVRQNGTMRGDGGRGPAALPMRVHEAVLRDFFREGEAVVVLVAKGIGSTHPYEFLDREGRSYLLVWDGRLDGHVIRLPLRLWMADEGRLAQVILDQRRLPFAMVVLVEPMTNDEGRMTNDE